MHQRCVRSRQRSRRGAATVVADIAKLSVGREEYYLRELAADHEAYLSGHGESPGRWYGTGAASLGLEGEASPAGFRRMFEGRHPDTGGSWAAPMARERCRRSTWSCARPRASRSSTASATRRLAGPPWPPSTPASARQSPTWMSTWGRAAATADTSMSRVGGCWRSASTTGLPGKVTRCCTPIWWWPTVSRGRTAGGRPWTALDGRDLYRHRLAADAIYRAAYQRELSRTLGVEDASRPPRQPGTRGPAREPGPAVFQADGPDRPGGGAAGGLRAGADTPAGQVGRPRHPQTQVATRPRTPRMDGGGPRRPSAATTRTPWSGR
jgi:hypothetical protein